MTNMSRQLENLVNWLGGGDVRNDSVTPLENGGASARQQNSDLARNTRTNTSKSTSRKRRSKLTNIVTLEEMKKDGVFTFWNAGSLTAADIWASLMLPDKKPNHTVVTHGAQNDTDANLAPCTTNKKGPRLSHICRRNSDIERKRKLDDWDDIPDLSIEEIMKGIVIPDKRLDHTVSNQDSQVDIDVNRTPCNTIEKDERLSSISSRNSQLSNSGTPPKRRKLNDMDDLPRASSKQSQKSAITSEQIDTTTGQADHTISTAKALVTTAAEQSQMSPRIPKRKKRRATRRRGKKRKNRPRNQ